MIKKIYISTILVLVFISVLTAQDRDRRPRTTKNIVYNTEISGQVQLMTNGWSVGGHYGIINTYYKTRLYTFELGEIKHPREQRQSNSIRGGGSLTNSARSYIYGKQNNFYTLKVGIGGKRSFSEKASRKGVGVGIFYTLGPSLGAIKPYYLEVRRAEIGSSNIRVESIKYAENNEFLQQDLIIGASSPLLGLEESSLTVGGHAKIGLHLDWGAGEEIIRALEVGISGELYTKKIPIMVTSDNRPFFFNLYVNAQLGKRK